MHAVPAHVADQVHLGESYKFTVIIPGRESRDGRTARKAAPGSQMVVLCSFHRSVLPFSLLPASRQQHAPPPSRTISRISLTYPLIPLPGSRSAQPAMRHPCSCTLHLAAALPTLAAGYMLLPGVVVRENKDGR